MENKELIMKGLETTLKEIANPAPVFTKEQYDEFKNAGLTPDEIATLEKAEEYAQIIDILPTDNAGIDKLIEAMTSLSDDNAEVNLNKLVAIAQKDPNLLMQLFAITAVAEIEFPATEE